ncbi:MAG TPA: aminoglycoside phosphotransferase family protein [Herpetosiphonaceae bacterium]|nr:aminoglycoside phosphotransferase family protein [Herpetosiphonaceae bacterium]
MESKTKNPKTRGQIAAMAARAFDGMALADGDDAVCELRDGWFNVTYRVRLADDRLVVLKIAPPPGVEVMEYERDLMTTEVACMRLVRQNPAIPVPEIYLFDTTKEICDADYFFMAHCPGDSLEHVHAQLTPEAKSAIELHIGAIIREINGFPGAYFGYDGNPDLRAASWKAAFGAIIDSILADGARKQVAYDYSPAEIRSAVQKYAAALEEVTAPVLVHWDAWNPNFFVQDNRIAGIIDFERALWADPLMEAQFRPFFGEGVTDLMRGYGKTAFTPAEEQRCQLYTLHLGLVMYTECAFRNYETDTIFNLGRDLIRGTMDWLQAQ